MPLNDGLCCAYSLHHRLHKCRVPCSAVMVATTVGEQYAPNILSWYSLILLVPYKQDLHSQAVGFEFAGLMRHTALVAH